MEGCPAVRGLLASGRYCVICRPHPLTGITEDNVGLADIRLGAMVREAAAVDPVADHRVDIDRDFAESAAASDLLICDLSGVSVDCLPSGKPLIITEPVGARLEIDPLRPKRIELVEYYLGDTTPGVATRRFIEASERVMEIRDRARAELVGRGPDGR